jgi:hypothetical protein
MGKTPHGSDSTVSGFVMFVAGKKRVKLGLSLNRKLGMMSLTHVL